MATFLQAFFALSVVIYGLSHVAQPRMWADFFLAMKRTGYAPFIIPFYTLPIGLVLILGHNRWVWDWPVVATIAGWGMTTKCVLYLIFPQLPNRMIENADRWQEKYAGFRVAGGFMAIVGAIVAWHAFQHWPAGL
jgi:uncharacterized protein YjeT (DUF2065 family)